MSTQVVIVGSGPAGLAAAQVLRAHDVTVTIVDEQPRPGGQFLRQPPSRFTVSPWLPGPLYERAKSVLEAVEGRQDIEWQLSSTVLGMARASMFRAESASAPHELWLQTPSGTQHLQANAVLLATGCYERPLPFPGWTLPGVLGAGAIQGFVKSQQFVPGNRFVLAGSHPLQLVVADQLVKAGAEVAAVAFTQRWTQAAALLRRPSILFHQRAQLFETSRMLRNLRRARVPVLFGTTIVAARGKDSVERVELAALQADGAVDHSRTQTIECDRVGVCYGFLASTELARQAGARTRWDEQGGGWIVDHDEWFESSIARLFVAGEVTGVAGADAALEKGRIAAAGVLHALGRIDTHSAERLARDARRRLARIATFASALASLARPPATLANETATPDTILCRCEEVTRGAFEHALRENPHVLSADAAKLLTRAGMGMCQGRLCGANAARVLATLRGVSVAEVGAFRARAPVKPVLLETIRS